jgi:hypothetical protein
LVVRRACLVLATVLCTPAFAALVCEMEITEQDGSYRTIVKARLEASAADVWRVLTDYANYVQVSPSIHRVRRLGPTADGGERLQTWTEACVFGFCRDISQLQEMRQLAFGELRAQILPGEDIVSGRAAWSLRGVGQSSRLRFEAQMTPAFWVPPLIGPWIIRRALKQELTDSLDNLERIALESADP